MATTGFSGQNIAVDFGATAMAGYFTDMSWKYTKGKKKRVDISSKASYVGGKREFEEGLKGDNDVSITLKVLYETGGASPVEDLTEGQSAALVAYPEGKSGGNPKATFGTCYVTDISFDGAYAGKLAYTVMFSGTAFPTFGTV